jgi:5'-3' exonuclease
MGVDGLFKFILSDYSDVLSKLYYQKGFWTTYDEEGKIIHVKEQMDHLYVDLNSIIHNATNFLKPRDSKSKVNEEPAPPRQFDVDVEIQNLTIPSPSFKELQLISKKVIHELNKIYNKYQPNQSYFISMVNLKKKIKQKDGSAPLAKLKKQKSSRFLSLVKNPQDLKSMILPSSRLMEMIKNDIKYMAQNNFENNVFHKDLIFHLSGSDEHGEAEIKIFNHISKVDDKENKAKYGILSPDSDLILMFLCCTMKNNIFLFRELKHGDGVERYSKTKFLQNFHQEIPVKQRKFNFHF